MMYPLNVREHYLYLKSYTNSVIFVHVIPTTLTFLHVHITCE